MSTTYLRAVGVAGSLSGLAALPLLVIFANPRSFFKNLKETEWEKSNILYTLPIVCTVLDAAYSTPRIIRNLESSATPFSINSTAAISSVMLVNRLMATLLCSFGITVAIKSDYFNHTMKFPRQAFQKRRDLPIDERKVTPYEVRVWDRMRYQKSESTEEHFERLRNIREQEWKEEMRYKTWPRYDTVSEGVLEHLISFSGIALFTGFAWVTAICFTFPILYPIGFVFTRHAIKHYRNVMAKKI